MLHLRRGYLGLPAPRWPLILVGGRSWFEELRMQLFHHFDFIQEEANHSLIALVMVIWDYDR